MLKAVLRAITAVMQSVASYKSMIQFTPTAIEELQKTLRPDELIRVAVRGGGCSGMSYTLDFETSVDEEDILLDIPEIKVYIDPYSADILEHTIVDYKITLQEKGFVFNNPDANTTCGCGSSFS